MSSVNIPPNSVVWLLIVLAVSFAEQRSQFSLLAVSLRDSIMANQTHAFFFFWCYHLGILQYCTLVYNITDLIL